VNLRGEKKRTNEEKKLKMLKWMDDERVKIEERNFTAFFFKSSFYLV
jgi:hypothetical protein